MSKGCRQRSNRQVPSPHPIASEAEHNLRRLNERLINIIKEKNMEISCLKENYENVSTRSARESERCATELYDAIECIKTKEQTIGCLLYENENMQRKLDEMSGSYQVLEETRQTTERGLMYRICNMEGKLEAMASEYKNAMLLWDKEKGFLRDYVRKMYEDLKKERIAWKEQKEQLEHNVLHVKRSLMEAQEEKDEISKNLCVLRRNNEVLARNLVKERDQNKRVDMDLEQRNKTLEIVFQALRTSRHDLMEEKKGSKALEEKIASMEAEVHSLRDENSAIKSKFNKLEESGAWTGVILDRQESIIKHLKESLHEERSRVHDYKANMEKFLEQLVAERQHTELASSQLAMSHLEILELRRCLTDIKEELMHRKNGQQEIAEELDALRNENLNAQEEMELLRRQNAKLLDRNDSLARGCSTLQHDLKRRLNLLKKGVGIIRASNL